MKINVKNLPTKIQEPIYCRGGIEIRMIVNTNDGEVMFEAYINGKYVPFSRNKTLFSTVRVLNNELSYRCN